MCVFGADEGAVFTGEIAVVSCDDLVEYFCFVGGSSGFAELVGSSFGSDLWRGVKVELDGGVGEHDGALVAALCDEARVVVCDPSLGFDEHSADGAVACDVGDGCGYIGVSEPVGEVDAVDVECGWVVVPIECDGECFCELCDGLCVGGGYVAVDG